MLTAACILGILIAAAVWLNLFVADFLSKMTPKEREEFEEKCNEDMGV